MQLYPLSSLYKNWYVFFSTLTGKMFSPLFQVFSMVLLLSTPFSFAQTFAAARAVLFSPNSTTEYRLPSSFNIIPREISEVVAILYIFKAAKVWIQKQK